MRALIGNMSKENEGVASRSIRQLFGKAALIPAETRQQYRFYVNMFQIYNESVHDLLNFTDEFADSLREEANPFALNSYSNSNKRQLVN